jgi:Ion channel
VPPRPGFSSIRLAERPSFLTVGSVRLVLLCGVIVAIGMIPGRLTSSSAGWVALGGLVGLPLAVAIPFLASVRDLAQRLPPAVAALRSIHQLGLVGLGAAFFLAWTLVYLALWWRHPHEAFAGLGPAPRFADFFYYSVSTAFISPPGDIVAHSRGARSATMIEMLTGFALLAVYLSSFVDWQRREPEPPAG